MAVMAKHVDVPFEISPDKIELFKKAFDIPKGQRGSDIALTRAKRFMTLPSFTVTESFEASHHGSFRL